jgi:asparagine synthase (glutamine-hydrolysing)
MLSESGRYVIVFNGEVYNFATLKEQLEALGHRFRGHSDTEVMLAAVEQWGLDSAVRRFVGMFSFALWDNTEHRLSLVRDRLGIKPLYYGWMGETLLCGSELKALRAHPDFHPEVDRDTLTLYMRHNYVPAPYSIYKGMHQLEPGCILTIGEGTASSESPRRYWSAQEVAELGAREPFAGSEHEAIEALDGLLRESIGMRMVADVPLGAFLSGGIDSSTVVALMQAQSARPVKTFSIGFSEAGYDEAPYARAVAGHLGTDHTELYVTPEEAQALIPMLPTMYDEPFGDPSQIPTFLVSRLARSQVTVSLSGDGGDELFCGYNRYFLTNNLWRKLRSLPRTPRKYLGKGIVAMSAPRYERWMKWLSPATERFGQVSATGHRLQRLGEVLSAHGPEDLYLGIVSHWSSPERLVLGGHEGPTALTSPGRWARLPDLTRRMMYLDMVTYLPGDILTKVDRASMAASLEARVPLLDHRVVEFAWQLPLDLKIRDGRGKWILRQVLSRYIPRELIERPKMGFGIPIDSWLRGPLRAWAETLLDERRLRDEGFLDPNAVRALWHAHLSGERNWQYRLWNILMFEAWLEHWMVPGQDADSFLPAGRDAHGSVSVA